AGAQIARALPAGGIVRWLAPAAIGFAVALPFLPFSSRYVGDVGTPPLIHAMLGLGPHVLVWLGGPLRLRYLPVYALRAYAYARRAVEVGVSFWLCLPFAGLLAALFGIGLGFPVLRLRGDYLAIVTLGFGEMIRIILINWQSFTNGPNGIASIPRPSFFG